jgi:hypothetical protein
VVWCGAEWGVLMQPQEISGVWGCQHKRVHQTAAGVKTQTRGVSTCCYALGSRLRPVSHTAAVPKARSCSRTQSGHACHVLQSLPVACCRCICCTPTFVIVKVLQLCPLLESAVLLLALSVGSTVVLFCCSAFEGTSVTVPSYLLRTSDMM